MSLSNVPHMSLTSETSLTFLSLAGNRDDPSEAIKQFKEKYLNTMLRRPELLKVFLTPIAQVIHVMGPFKTKEEMLSTRVLNAFPRIYKELEVCNIICT